MSAVCPKCGVAVVPGYVKCPKCQAPMPRRRSQTHAAGGTAMAGGGISLPVVLLAVAALGGVAYLVLRGGKAESTADAKPTVEPVETDPVERPVVPELDVVTPTAPQPTGSDPTVAVRDLDRALKKERLWGTVEVVGSRVDVRSAACGDAAMMPVVEAAIPALREGGVVKVRCLEQAGAVVFEREL